MKKIAFVCAASLFACGVALAKDAKRPAAMSDAEMDAVTAGDILVTVPGLPQVVITTPTFNGTSPEVNASATLGGGTQVVIQNTVINPEGFAIKVTAPPALDNALIKVFHVQ